MSNLSQFFSVIKSIQYGTITLSSIASNTATITSVNTAKAVLIYLGMSANDTTITNDVVRITLTDSVTVTANRFASTGSVTVSFVVVEFY